MFRTGVIDRAFCNFMVKLIGVLKMILLNPPNGPALSYHPAIFPRANISVLKVFWHFKSNFCIRTSLLNCRLLILFNDSLISDWQLLFCDYFLPGGRPFISFTFNITIDSEMFV